ncbi:ABC transporter substrate-binding protein [Chloroflexi bacterium TSY]|nr:ABC transporter substrate-binding protein [Chloroflexi bacterium TSY]
MSRNFNRREVLKLSGTMIADTFLTACGSSGGQEAAPAGDSAAGDAAAESAAAVGGKESPMLTRRVEAGQLPPVEERLPLSPQIVETWEGPGEYGGMFTVGNPSAGTFHSGRTGVGQEGVLRIGTDLRTVEPNIAESFELSEDGMSLTLHLREGLRWSDGQPHTADDIMFYFEDVLGNDDLSPTKPTWLKPGGESVATAEKIDDFTVRILFDQPYPFILKYLAHIQGTGLVYPKHYSSQFHANYVDEAELTAKVEEAGYDDWTGYFRSKAVLDEGVPENNPELPTLAPYKLLEKTETHWLFERNPYYWKVDPDGNQLPYIDAAFIKILLDNDIQDAAMISGELDIEFGWMPNASNWPLYKTNEEQGQYKAFTVPNLTGAAMLFQPNQTYEEDTTLRDIFRDKRFRIALSHAINRDEINELAFFGRATPQQATVIPAASYYVEEYAKLYTEYDVDQANALLDEMGLEWDSNNEWRLRPDGEKLAWTIESGVDPQTNTVWQLVKGYWQAIGLDVSVKTITGELISERYPGNQVAMGTWGADKCTDWLFPLTPQFWVPYNLGWESTMYPQWTRWLVSGGESGEEPTDENMQILWDLWQEMKTTTDIDRQVELGKEIVRINAENVYVIGTCAMPPHPVIVKDNLGNMPTPEQGLLFGWDLYQFAPWHSEQLYLKRPLYPRQEYDA